MPITGTYKKELKSLGKTPGEIKKKLVKLNCVGIKGEPNYCPIARYFYKKNIVDCYVYETNIEIFGELHGINKQLKKFIENFDNGKYPELEVDVVDNV
jgi:hypothetical protein